MAPERILLPARIRGTMRRFVQDADSVRAAARGYGTPLHVLFPDAVEANALDFADTLAQERVEGEIRFALKPNRSLSLVRAAERAGIGADISSEAELMRAFAAGIPADRVEATGPKDNAFLRALARHGITVSLDSLGEIGRLGDILARIGRDKPLPALLRLSGFAGLARSRFGIDLDRLDDAIDLLRERAGRMALAGVSFHVDERWWEAKVRAFDRTLEAIDRLMDSGFDIRVVNIGGGFGTGYLESPEDAAVLALAAREWRLADGRPVFWSRHPGGAPEPASYPADPGPVGSDALAAFLSAPLPRHGGMTVARVLRERLLSLRCEPGRAMLDQAGATVARVIDVRHYSCGDHFVTLDLNGFGIGSKEQEVFVDPVLVPGAPDDTRESGAYPAWIAGNLCLESDFVTRRRVFLPHPPEVGDLLVFPNTAAYRMDFTESDALSQRRAGKIAVAAKAGTLSFVPDDRYDPLDPVL